MKTTRLVNREFCISVLICIAVVALDQHSKATVKKLFMKLNFSFLASQRNEIWDYHITPFLNLVYTHNYGVSFGIMNNPEQNQYVWVFISLCIIALMAMFLWQKHKVCLAMIIG